METITMLYKSIIHDLIQQRPDYRDQLRKARKLLPTLEKYARELKTSHEAWQKLLLQMRPGSDRGQIASEAMELALKEMEDRLPYESSPNESEGQILDAAMLFLSRRTSRA
jgi:FtsZ-binding cell division protein ZapB